MAEPTAAELLAATNVAIRDVLTKGQHIGAEGQTWRLADLDQLRDLRKTLQTEVNGAAGGSMKTAFSGIVQRRP